MKVLIHNLVISMIVDVFLVTAIDDHLQPKIREIKYRKSDADSVNVRLPRNQLNGLIFVQNDAKGEILITVAYIFNNKPITQDARVKPNKSKKFVIPSVAKNAVIKIEDWSLYAVKLAVSGDKMVPYRKELLKDGMKSASDKKCYRVVGSSVNMIASEVPCPRQ